MADNETKMERAWRAYSCSTEESVEVPKLFAAGWRAARLKQRTDDLRRREREYSAAIQARTADTAVRTYRRWEDWELEILYRPGLSRSQIAEMTGRTLAGVHRARKNYPRPEGGN